ncbi:predicted protein [Arabidopsis lyrata subsp. lyrata]|uniref:Predicted protein n=1 Tax=Arabidopsis lyrata subsp. lyrata TaxID=81972 RepID=D7MK97_ARALL|nr:predicted protein [Arabidopsis lyrata subsp. lyrata]
MGKDPPNVSVPELPKVADGSTESDLIIAGAEAADNIQNRADTGTMEDVGQIAIPQFAVPQDKRVDLGLTALEATKGEVRLLRRLSWKIWLKRPKPLKKRLMRWRSLS